MKGKIQSKELEEKNEGRLMTQKDKTIVRSSILTAEWQ